jgi:hypothetical protein
MSGSGRAAQLTFCVQEINALHKAFKDIPNVLRKDRKLSDGNVNTIRNALTAVDSTRASLFTDQKIKNQFEKWVSTERERKRLNERNVAEIQEEEKAAADRVEFEKGKIEKPCSLISEFLRLQGI